MTGGNSVPDIDPEDDTVGPVGVTGELNQAHSKITGIMIDHANGDFTRADDLVFTATFIDDHNQELVVMLDPVLLSLESHPDKDDIADLLGDDVKIRVSYGIFVPESHNSTSHSQINLWLDLYSARCDSPTHNSLCEVLASNLGQAQYTLDSDNVWQPPDGAASYPKPTAQANCEDSSTFVSWFGCALSNIGSGIFGTTPNAYVHGGNSLELRYRFVNSTGEHDGEDPSTATIGATDKNGVRGIVVSGHALNPREPGSIQFTKTMVANISGTFMNITEPGFPGTPFSRYSSSSADAAFLPLPNGIGAREDSVMTQNGTIISIVGKGGLEGAGKYPGVTILGRATNSDGYVTFKNVTVRDDGGILTKQATGTYSSVQTDSGAPIIHYNSNGDANLFGMHVGKLCSTNFNDEVPEIVSNKRDCQYYHLNINVFSPWENMKEELNLN